MKKTFTFFAAIIQAIVLLCLQTLTAQTVLFHEDFEGGVLPAGWTVVDADGDGYGWETGSAGISGHNSTACFFSRSWLQETSAALTPDNWLITPAVTLTSDATLSFWVCAQDVNYAAEHYGVYISTTGTATTDFTLLYEETLDANGGAKAQGLWKQKTVDLSEYTGQTVRIAFRHFDCTDQFVLNLDDVEMVAIDPIIATNPSTINFGDVLLAHSKTVIVDVSTYSLTNIVTINTSAPFSISIDGTIYDTIVSLPASGGNIYVQYTPSTIGTDNGTVFLSSDSVSLSIAISGNGVVCSMPKTLPFTEDFDDEEFPPVCWNLISQNEETWKNNYYVTNWAFCKWSEENKTEQLETCVLDLSQATHPVLRFDFMSNYEYVGWGYVDFKIYVSTDGGGTYSPTPIWELSQFGPFDDWTKTKAKVDLVAFAGQSAVKFKFSYEGQYCSVYFDNVEIKNAVVSPEMIVYVKQNASGTGDGSSWDNAMDDIVEAIGIASLLDGVQVWVATGTYYGDTTAASENAFTVVDGVNVYGGFAGVEPANYDLSLRDLEMNETILDGLNERRVLIQPVQYSNYHTIWDGFTIQNGRSTGIGGGAYIIRGMTLGHCRIHNNYSDASGGGVYIYNNARVADCRIYNNESSDCGGGLYANAAAVINSCIISNNVAAHQGGGIYANNSEVRNCLISNNTVSSGYNTDAIGGGVFSSNSTIINSTIVRNEGKGFYGSGNVINSIVWGNSDPVNVGGDGFTCSYSAIENGCVGEGNIHLMDGDGYRPLFVNPALVAGNTDATTSIDWHLQEGSVCINKGNNAVVTGNFDLDGTVRIKRDTVDLGCYESDYYNVSGDSTIYVNYTGVVYVTQTGAGNFSGNNWENAMSSLETAQVVALTHNAVVWVATGIYYGDTTATSENAFAMVEGVNVYGGFAGNEPEDYDLSLRDFEANATILDGQNVRRVLYGYEKTDVVWDGFTITNGNVGGGEGGGVYMKGDILLSNCVINNNSAGSGGGVYAVGDYRGKPEILSCEISNNVTSWPGAEYGGGLYVEDCFVKKCLILNNDAGSNGTGGGVYLWGNSKMRNCIISGNTARFGGGVSCGTGGTYGPSIINCLISNNSASEYDGIGGVRCYSKVIVNNSTIVSNKGGGLSASYDSLLLSNSIVWGNQTSDGISSNLSGTVFCSYSAVEDGAAGNQNILLSDAFHQAPLFVHPSLTAGASDTTSNVDWHLQQESPCINRGDNSVVTDSVDLDGTARIKRDTVDLGCYESDFYSNPVIAPNYSNVIYVTPNGAGTQTGEDWDNATSSLTFALSVAENSNADVWVAAGVYYGDTTAENAFTMRERVNVYGGFAGNEPSNYDLSLRDFDANATILDGQSVRRVLYQPSNFYMLTIWDGITIQNGQSVNDYGYGGGAYLRNNGLLRHCVVKNNAAWQGGGVYYSGSDYGYDGGELLSHCIIKNNTAVNGGGGICLSSWSYGGKVSHCIISNNAAASGGGIYSYCGWSNHVVSNCLISNNTADHSGGGVYDNNAIITNSTIVSNIADLGSGVYGDSDGILTNCIVWGNGADELNNVYGSITCSYSAVEGGFAGEQNILLSDYLQQTPKFVHPSLTSGASDTTSNVDWHLQQGSVCINRGNNSFIIDSIDLDGVTRIRRDTVDLGCYESDFYSNPIVAPNYSNVIYVTQNGAGAKTGEDWENATSSISFALVAARTYNADVWVASGIYYGDTASSSENAFTMVEGVNVYGGFAGNEPVDYDISLRDYEVNTTILDGQNARRVLYQPSSFTTLTIWDGFTIQNGQVTGNGGGAYLNNKGDLSNCVIKNNAASNGGGVYADYYGTVSNCIISNNTATSYGGGVYASSYGAVSNCLISNNTASYGGGVYNNNATINNSTIVRNMSSGNGAGVCGNNQGNLTNSIVWGNGTNESNNIAGSITCSYSAVEGVFTGEQNILLSDYLQLTPQFVHPSLVSGASDTTTNVDWHLQQGSVCINRGNNTFIIDSIDLDGVARVRRDTVDLGCYESDFYSNPIVYPDYSNVIYVTQNGAGTQTGVDWGNATSSLTFALAVAKMFHADIWVATGIYYGDTTAYRAFSLGDSVNVYGGFAGNEPADYDLSLRDCETNVTILDGQHSRGVLSIGKQCICDGFTIQNGKSSGRDGGGVNMGSSILTNCTITHNEASNGWGGGVYCAGGTVSNCDLEYNSCYYSGGGVYCNSTSVSNCKLSHNSAGWGGGIYANTQSDVENCIITDNVSRNYGGGVGVYEASRISNSVVSHNRSERFGGGIWANDATVQNCLVSNNTDSVGGGITVYDNGTIVSSTIAKNLSTFEGAGVYCYNIADVTLVNTIVFGNVSDGSPSNLSGTFTCSFSAVEGGCEGDSIITLSAENPPLFVTPSLTAGSEDSTANVDWHLLQGSPCINRGDNSAAMDGLDLDGTARIKRDTVDMGCYESDFYNVPVPLCTTVYGDFYDTICESYTWNDQSYTQSGDYTQTFELPNGCDSIVTLHLTVLPSTVGDFAAMTPTNNYPLTSYPVRFTWDVVENASDYDLYVWPVGETQPQQPVASHIHGTTYTMPTLPNYTDYQWYMVAYNACDTTVSTARQFSLNVTPSLTVTAANPVDFGEVPLNSTRSVYFQVKGVALDSVISYQITGTEVSSFSLTPASSWDSLTGGGMQLTFHPTVPQNEYTAQMIFQSDSLIKTITVKGYLSDYLTFTTYVDTNIYAMDSEISIHGQVTNPLNEPVAGLELEVYVKVMDYVRTFPAISDANGQYTVTFTPQHSEAGYYTVGSRRAGGNSTAVHDDFNIPGMMLVSSDWILWEPTVDQPDTGTIAVRNRSQIPLTNIQVTPLSLPNGCMVQFVPMNLAGMATGNLQYIVSGSEVSTGVNYEEVRLNAVSDEGAAMNFSVWYYCLPQRADLDVTPTSLITTMTRGKSKVVDFMIYNNGTGPTGNIYVSLPDVPWMSVVGGDTLPSLAVHDSAYVSIRLSADSTTALVRYTGNIAINCDRGEGVSIPYSITAISDSTGTLLVDVTDEYTWNTNNGHGPHLAGANVTLKGYYSLETVATGVTDVNGQFVVNDLPEGWYKLIVRADKHEEYQNNLYITAGDTNLQDIFISFQAITYTWEVVPTEIEDEYTYELNVEFETHVPKPVIVVETSRTIPELEPGESMNFDLIITNHGLIAGFDLEIFFPEMDDYVFTPLISVADTIPALTTLIIPVNVRKKENEVFSAKVYWDGMELVDTTGDPCWKRIGTKCNYICGPDKHWVLAYTKPVFMNTCWATNFPIGRVSPPSPHSNNTSDHEHHSSSVIDPPKKQLISCDTCDFLLLNIIESCPPIIGDIVSAAEGDYGNNDASFELISDMHGAISILKKVTDFSQDVYSTAKEIHLDVDPVCAFHVGAYSKCQFSKELNKAKKLLNNPREMFAHYYAVAKEIVSEKLDALSDNCYHLIEYGKEFISGGNTFSEQDIINLIEQMSDYDIPDVDIRAFALRWNAYVLSGGLINPLVDGGLSQSKSVDSLPPINGALLDSLFTSIMSLTDSIHAMGYDRLDDMYYDAMSILDSLMEGVNTSTSVCSSVTVQFSQKMTMTREAFEGTLTINNGHESQPMQDIDVDFVIRDEDGVDCTNLFQINFQSYNNMTGSNGSLVLGALNEGSIVVQFIPTKQAAPTMPKQYSFGGSFSFIDPFTGESMTYNLYPVDIMVNPSPDLYVNYFMQRDILGDDPLTEDRIEPIVPAELGVIIHNRGAGTAKNVLLETAEPQIIENEKGLAIDFAMYGASFNGQERQLGLMEIPFGNIEPNHTGVGEWWFTSTLLGHFVSYEAHVIHNNSFGNPDLSLVSSLDIHPLIHTVYAYGDLDDGINDFLVDDEEDSHNYPDSLYFSNGSRTGVATADSIGFDHYVTPLDTIVILTLDPSRIGWNYEQTWDPGRGQYKLISCTRNSDQQVIPLSNVWQSHVTIPVGADPVYENKLHIVDTLSNDLPTTYTLVFSLKEVVLEVDTILDVPDAIITSPLSEVTVKFNKPIVDSTFNYLDMSLKCNNGANLLDENMSLERLDPMTYKLHLEPYTGQSGYYVLNIQTLDITDVDGFNGYYVKQAAWIQNIITCQPDSVSISAVACDSFDWYGATYTTSGDYTHTLTNVAGCDSVVTLHLTVNYSNTGDTTAVACDSFDWYGATYKTSGDYSYTLTNASGCDSVVTLHLTVNYSNTGDTTAVACDSFYWYGTTYTSSGDYTRTFTNADGCDSVVTLHLTVNYSNIGDTTAVACDSFDWYGTTYTTSGDYTHTLTNASGCDSVVTLHLTVNYSNAGDTAAVACDSFDWYGATYTSSGDYTHTLTNASGCDSVVTLHLTVNYSNIGDTTAIACDSFNWYGTTYTSSGDYSHTLTNVAGCDSVVTLHLTVNYSNTGDTAAVVCDSFDWYGATYTTSGDYTHTLTNASGCDSVVTLHLTVNYSNTGDTAAVACDSFDWYGATYTTSGDYTHTLTNANGCDSVVTLHLTVNYSNVGDTAAVACDSFDWYGSTYTTSGDYSYTLTNASGCDSVVTLHLTVNYSNTGDTSAVACDSFDWYGTTYTSSGDYTRIFTNADGCDSVVTLHLTVNYSNTGDTAAVACDSFDWYGAIYTTSGDYTHTLTNASGCDSVVTLHLTVNYSNTGDTNAIACDSYAWNDSVYTQSGDYVQTFTNVDGCDSIVMLHLTVNHSVTTEYAETACDSYIWNDSVYTQSGDYVQAFTNAVGCDSVVTLHLTVNHSETMEYAETACDSYTWNDSVYTQSGDYVQTFTNANGCDSVVTLHLTVNYSTAGDTTTVVCDSFDWYGATYTASGDYTHTLTNANGCDSVVTLHLTVNPIYNINNYLTICESELPYHYSNGLIDTTFEVGTAELLTLNYYLLTESGCDSIVTFYLTVEPTDSTEFAVTTDSCYIWNGLAYCASGNYTQIIQNAYGCDSVVTLHLTVTVGIDGYNGFDIVLYPNPAREILNVQCTMGDVCGEDATVELLDVYGKLLQTVRMSPETTTLNVGGLAGGVYFVRVTTDRGTVTKPFVKK